MPIVYIDLLFLLNFLMDFVILYCTSLFLKQTNVMLRITTASIVLAIYSAIMFFPKISFAYTLAGKIAVLSLSVFIAFPSANFAGFVKNAITYFAINGIFGGVMLTLIFATDFGTRVGAAVSNGEIYLNISASSILLSIIPAYFAAFVISYIRKQNIKLSEYIADLEISFGEKSVKTKAYCDTGCKLCEPITKKPAIIIDKSLAKKLFDKPLYKTLTAEYISDRTKIDECIHILPYSTIDKDFGVLLGVVPRKATLNNTVIDACIVAVAKHKLCNDTRFNAIFDPDILKKEQNYKTSHERTEYCAE